ncbi:hypothetical protein MRY87_12850 [bacterium]|nr:hypothetical protein [bacterium]
MRAAFFHPLLVHFPIVLSLLSILALVWWRNQLQEQRTPLLFLSLSVLISSLFAFYSGSWSGDLIVERLSPEASESYSWHYLWGRLSLFTSVVTAILVLFATLATKKREIFFWSALISALTLTTVILLAATSGGELVHTHLTPRLFHTLMGV